MPIDFTDASTLEVLVESLGSQDPRQVLHSLDLLASHGRSRLVPPLLLDYASILGRVIFLSPYAVSRRPAIKGYWRDHRAAVIGVAVFNPLAYILVLTALVSTPVIYVAPAREVSVLLTVLVGAVLLREGSLRQRMGWAGLIFLGMVLLAVG